MSGDRRGLRRLRCGMPLPVAADRVLEGCREFGVPDLAGQPEVLQREPVPVQLLGANAFGAEGGREHVEGVEGAGQLEGRHGAKALLAQPAVVGAGLLPAHPQVAPGGVVGGQVERLVEPAGRGAVVGEGEVLGGVEPVGQRMGAPRAQFGVDAGGRDQQGPTVLVQQHAGCEQGRPVGDRSPVDAPGRELLEVRGEVDQRLAEFGGCGLEVAQGLGEEGGVVQRDVVTVHEGERGDPLRLGHGGEVGVDAAGEEGDGARRGGRSRGRPGGHVEPGTGELARVPAGQDVLQLRALSQQPRGDRRRQAQVSARGHRQQQPEREAGVRGRLPADPGAGRQPEPQPVVDPPVGPVDADLGGDLDRVGVFAHGRCAYLYHGATVSVHEPR